MRRRCHGCANVRPLFRNFQMHFRPASSDVSMMAAWGRAAGHHQSPSRNRHAMISNAISNLIMFDLRGVLSKAQITALLVKAARRGPDGNFRTE
jgi:hypothetical protein